MNKKATFIVVLGLIIIALSLTLDYVMNNNNNNKPKIKKEVLEELPLPEVTGGVRGELGIDKNINEETIDKYLNRSDSVYRDMRMLDDPGNYEAIGGDSKLSGYVKGFEVIPLPYIIPVTDLPEEVGGTYKGKTLFSVTSDGKFVANYEESMDFIEKYFPKDKYIFLMCGGGGYAGTMKKFLVSLGWDETKIYNVGGYWYYDGKNNVEVKKIENGKITYDFDNVPYIDINFESLKEINNSNENQQKPNNPVDNSNSTVTSNSNITSNSNNTSNNASNSNNLPIRLEEKYYNNTSIKEYETIDLEQINNECLGIDSDNDKENYDKCKLKFENAMKEKSKIIDKLIDNKESFVMRIAPGDVCYGTIGPDINMLAGEFSKKNNIYFYNVSLGVYKYTKLYSKAKYAPSVIVVSKGEILVYTDPNKDEYTELGKDYKKFEQWIKKYIEIK